MNTFKKTVMDCSSGRRCAAIKIKLIDFGLKADHHPFRPHENDAGADVFMPYDYTLQPGEVVRIPLGFGLIIPDGFAGYVFPRSTWQQKD